MTAPLIALFTDFGLEGPYVGQMKAVLAHQSPGIPVVDLMHDAPAFDIESTKSTLNRFCRYWMTGSWTDRKSVV